MELACPGVGQEQRASATLQPLRQALDARSESISRVAEEGERTGDVGAVTDSQPARRRAAVVAKRMRRMSDSGLRCGAILDRVRHSPVTHYDVSSRHVVSVVRCLALVADLEDRARLRTALVGLAELDFVACVAEVLQALRRDRGGIRAVVLEARDGSGRPTGGLARQITRLFPSTTVIGYCSPRAEGSADVTALASAGVHEVVFKHLDEGAGLLRAILRSAEQACAADLVMHHLGERLPPRIRPFVEYCLTNPNNAHSVEQVAQALGTHRKTLVNQCKAEGFPPPGVVIAWCLILLTAGLLAVPGVTVQQIAMQLNFPCATALRNLLRRHTGLRPSELRTASAVAELCGQFLAADARHASVSSLHERPCQSRTSEASIGLRLVTAVGTAFVGDDEVQLQVVSCPAVKP
jgi:AraC-like DNA-binding protein